VSLAGDGDSVDERRPPGAVGPLVILAETERTRRKGLEALRHAARAELRHVLMLPDFERATGSVSSGATPGAGRSRAADLLRG
jgi:hypothetical protein